MGKNGTVHCCCALDWLFTKQTPEWTWLAIIHLCLQNKLDIVDIRWQTDNICCRLQEQKNNWDQAWLNQLEQQRSSIIWWISQVCQLGTNSSLFFGSTPTHVQCKNHVSSWHISTSKCDFGAGLRWNDSDTCLHSTSTDKAHHCCWQLSQQGTILCFDSSRWVVRCRKFATRFHVAKQCDVERAWCKKN